MSVQRAPLHLLFIFLTVDDLFITLIRVINRVHIDFRSGEISDKTPFFWRTYFFRDFVVIRRIFH